MNTFASTDVSGTSAITGVCDTHVHVFNPNEFAYDEHRAYTPGEARCHGLEQHLEQVGASRCVVVQPSVYGSDNRCLLAALDHFGASRARGVAVIDHESVTDREIAQLYNAGVRAIRVNFEASQTAAPINKLATIRATALRLKGSGMAIQLYVDTKTAAAAIEDLAGEDVTMILDHFAGFKCGLELNSEPFTRLLKGLESGNVWVKLSAPCRAGSRSADYEDLRPAAQAMIAAAPDRMVWASDWPHTGGGGDRSKRSPSDIEPFMKIDDHADINRLRAWIADDSLFVRILAENPARIFDFPHKS